MDLFNKLFGTRPNSPKTGDEPDYDYNAIFGIQSPEGSNPVSDVEVDGIVEVDPVSKSGLEQKVELEPTSNFEVEDDDSRPVSQIFLEARSSENPELENIEEAGEADPAFSNSALSDDQFEAALSAAMHPDVELGLDLEPQDDDWLVEAVDAVEGDGDAEPTQSEVPEIEKSFQECVLEATEALTGCGDLLRVQEEYRRLVEMGRLSPHERKQLFESLVKASFEDRLTILEPSRIADEALSGNMLPNVEFDDALSDGFELEPFEAEQLRSILQADEDDGEERIADVDALMLEATRTGSAIRWTDGLANPIMWSLEHDWTKRELSIIKGFLSKLSATVENRGVLLDAENIKIMAETISIENVGRTMYLLSEPWMSRKKMNSKDAMVLASKIGPKINNSLKFESLVDAGLSKSFAETAAEFETKLGQASRYELRHVVEVLRSFRTPLAYTMATSLDYVCACLGDRAAMVRVSDAIQLLLDDDMVEPESLRRDMCNVAENWQRLAHAQYFHGDNSFEAFEQRLALETIDLTGRTGKIAFDEDVELPMSSVDVEAHRGSGHVLANDGFLSGMDNMPKEGDLAYTSAHPHVDPIIESMAASMGLGDNPDAEEFIKALSTVHSQAAAEDYDRQSISVLTTNPMDDRIRIRVLDNIAGGDSNLNAEKNYGHLLRPLPIMASPDADKLYADLMSEFPWMAEANEFVARAAALGSRQLGECFTIPPTLLHGPSGVGKTRWVRRVAKLSSVPMHLISVAGSDSSKAIMGSERGWSNARPSLPVIALAATQVVNPIIMVDELDKANASSNGDPFAALLPMLAKETHASYPDAYLLGSVDLSYASFIFTANSIAKLGNELLDRLKVLNVNRPSIKDYPTILNGIILEAAQDAMLEFEVVEEMREEWTSLGMDALGRGDSLRKVEQAITDAIGKHIWNPKPFLTVVK